MELNDQALTVVELRHRIATRLNQPEMLRSKDEHDNVSIRFAPRTPCRCAARTDNWRLWFRGSLVRAEDGREWENFQVQAYYRPHINGRRAEFAREGAIRLIGDGLSMRSQIALRASSARPSPSSGPWSLRRKTCSRING